MTIHVHTNGIMWKADFLPRNVTPSIVKTQLNLWVERFEAKDHYCSNDRLFDLINSIHSLAIKLPDIAVISSGNRYVAMPVEVGAVLAVDIRRLVKTTDPEYVNLPAWADIKKKYQDAKGDGVY